MGKLVIRMAEGIIPELDASESAASVLGRDPLVKRGHNQPDLEGKLPEPFADCRSTLTSLVVWDQQDTAEGGLKGGHLAADSPLFLRGQSPVLALLAPAYQIALPLILFLYYKTSSYYY